MMLRQSALLTLMLSVAFVSGAQGQTPNSDLVVAGRSFVGGDWRVQLAAIGRQSPWVGDLVAGARLQSDRPATIANLPFGYVRSGPAAPGVLSLAR